MHCKEPGCHPTVWAPINIALLKYWGKRDASLNLPLHDSISITLEGISGPIGTFTSLTLSESEQDAVSFHLNGTEDPKVGKRCLAMLNEIRARNNLARTRHTVAVESRNESPTSAGLASSASGFAALSTALHHALGLSTATTGSLGSAARIGSGSACRSLHGGFVHWRMGTAADGSDSVAYQLFDEAHWPELRALIVIQQETPKEVPSRDGMQASVATSDLLRARMQPDYMASKVLAFIKAIEERNFAEFARLTMKDACQFHAICMDTYPPIFYLGPSSIEAIKAIHRLNSTETIAAYTFDAGPNPVVFCLEANMQHVRACLATAMPDSKLIECRVGHGPKIL